MTSTKKISDHTKNDVNPPKEKQVGQLGKRRIIALGQGCSKLTVLTGVLGLIALGVGIAAYGVHSRWWSLAPLNNLSELYTIRILEIGGGVSLLIPFGAAGWGILEISHLNRSRSQSQKEKKATEKTQRSENNVEAKKSTLDKHKGKENAKKSKIKSLKQVVAPKAEGDGLSNKIGPQKTELLQPKVEPENVSKDQGGKKTKVQDKEGQTLQGKLAPQSTQLNEEDVQDKAEHVERKSKSKSKKRKAKKRALGKASSKERGVDRGVGGSVASPNGESSTILNHEHPLPITAEVESAPSVPIVEFSLPISSDVSLDEEKQSTAIFNQLSQLFEKLNNGDDVIQTFLNFDADLDEPSPPYDLYKFIEEKDTEKLKSFFQLVLAIEDAFLKIRRAKFALVEGVNELAELVGEGSKGPIFHTSHQKFYEGLKNSEAKEPASDVQNWYLLTNHPSKANLVKELPDPQSVIDALKNSPIFKWFYVTLRANPIETVLRSFIENNTDDFIIGAMLKKTIPFIMMQQTSIVHEAAKLGRVEILVKFLSDPKLTHAAFSLAVSRDASGKYFWQYLASQPTQLAVIKKVFQPHDGKVVKGKVNYHPEFLKRIEEAESDGTINSSLGEPSDSALVNWP